MCELIYPKCAECYEYVTVIYRKPCDLFKQKQYGRCSFQLHDDLVELGTTWIASMMSVMEAQGIDTEHKYKEPAE